MEESEEQMFFTGRDSNTIGAMSKQVYQYLKKGATIDTPKNRRLRDNAADKYRIAAEKAHRHP